MDRSSDQPIAAAPPERSENRLATRLLWLLALVVFIVSVTLWSPFSDGRMAVIDPVLYAQGVEAAESLTNDPELGATNANHILYHFALFGLTRGFESLGISHPGHHATQVLSGLGTALCVLLLGLLAGPERRWVGLACAAVLVSMRGSFYHACGGETVPLATALSLATLFLASKDRPSLVAVGLTLGAAFLARQDSIFITPAVFVLLIGRVRFWPMVVAFAAAGAMPVATWYLAWSANDAVNSIATFKDFVLGIGNHGTFSFAEIVGLSSPHLLAVAFHNAFVPQIDALDSVPVALGLVPITLLAGVAFVWRGRSGGRNTRLLAAFATLFVCRQSFFLWFEPQNWEWQVPLVAMGLGLLARSTRGEAISSAGLRRLGGVALVVFGACVFSLHLPASLRARHDHLDQSVETAVAAAGSEAQYLCLGFKPFRLAGWRGFDSVKLDDAHSFTALPSRWRDWPVNVLPFARAQGVDVVLLVDVFVRNGQPYTRQALGDAVQLASDPRVVESDELTFLWHDGRLFGLWAHPKR
ncbi:MAG: hypothetical protein AAF196_06745 [Planctomycetota bacterium]